MLELFVQVNDKRKAQRKQLYEDDKIDHKKDIIRKMIESSEPTPGEVYQEVNRREIKMYSDLDNEYLVAMSLVEAPALGFVNYARFTPDEEIKGEMEVEKAFTSMTADFLVKHMKAKGKTTLYIDHGQHKIQLKEDNKYAVLPTHRQSNDKRDAEDIESIMIEEYPKT